MDDRNSEGFSTITPEEARAMMDDGDVVILDVREPSEFATGHVPGAINVPLGEIRMGRTLPECPDLDRPSSSTAARADAATSAAGSWRRAATATCATSWASSSGPTNSCAECRLRNPRAGGFGLQHRAGDNSYTKIYI